MRKEVVLAVIAGSVMGLVIAFGIWRANSSIAPIQEKPQANIAKPGDAGLTLASPQNEAISVERSIAFSGITKASSQLAISGEENDYVLQASDSGSFEIDVNLVGGLNEVITTAFAPDGSEKAANTLVVYSSEFAKSLSSSSTQDSQASGEAGVRERVQERLDSIKKNPLAYIGTVTDITQSTIQLKTQSGEIKQAGIDDSVTYAKVGTTTKEVKATDLAIGDFVLALGFKNGNGVLHTERVLITDPYKPSTRKAVMGEIIKIDKKTITLRSSGKSDEWIIDASNAPRVTKVTEGTNVNIALTTLKVGQKIIAIGETKDKTLTARRLHLLP